MIIITNPNSPEKRSTFTVNVDSAIVSMGSLKTLLKALHCPFTDEFCETDFDHVVTLVRWLEDRIIREYEQDERDALLCANNEAWSDNINKYLHKLGCPFEWSAQCMDSLHWLVAFAVDLKYDDELENAMEVEEPELAQILTKIESIGKSLMVERASTESNTGTILSFGVGDYSCKLISFIPVL